jgi:hypothetical protein
MSRQPQLWVTAAQYIPAAAVVCADTNTAALQDRVLLDPQQLEAWVEHGMYMSGRLHVAYLTNKVKAFLTS